MGQSIVAKIHCLTLKLPAQTLWQQFYGTLGRLGLLQIVSQKTDPLGHDKKKMTN
jgi:hypothetical protein